MSLTYSGNLVDLINPGTLDVSKDMNDPYICSKFEAVRACSIKQRGCIYEKITQDIYTNLGHEVSERSSSDHDMVIDGRKCEVKGATLNKASNYKKFTFNQIRPDQDYDVIVFTLIFPDAVHILEMDKDIAYIHCADEVFVKQHGGKKGSGVCYCITASYNDLLELGANSVVKSDQTPSDS